MRRDPGEFSRRQKAYWQDVDERHFRWQTEGPYISATEAALVARAQPRAGERVLEIGCGEGANLVHLRQSDVAFHLFAVDFSHANSRSPSRASSFITGWACPGWDGAAGLPAFCASRNGPLPSCRAPPGPTSWSAVLRPESKGCPC